MKEYQPEKNNPYWLPQNLYMSTLYAIRDYQRLKDEYDDMFETTQSNDGQPRGTKVGDPTAQKAAEVSNIGERVKAIQRAEEVIPREYREGIWNNILYKQHYPKIADRATWSRQRCKFIYFVAKNMRWI